MDEANDEGEVTVPTALVLDLVDECRHLGAVAAPLIRMTRHLDVERPGERCSIDLLNDASDWIERELGMTSVRLAGRQVGHRFFAAMRTLGLPEAPPTLQLMRTLENASRKIVSDPQDLGWELLRHDHQSAVMRNTQDTNCVLSEGVLLSLMDHTPARRVHVRQVNCARRGDEHCDFEITWNE
jgi:predicted hydrocarbon binding protein